MLAITKSRIKERKRCDKKDMGGQRGKEQSGTAKKVAVPYNTSRGFGGQKRR